MGWGIGFSCKPDGRVYCTSGCDWEASQEEYDCTRARASGPSGLPSRSTCSATSRTTSIASWTARATVRPCPRARLTAVAGPWRTRPPRGRAPSARTAFTKAVVTPQGDTSAGGSSPAACSTRGPVAARARRAFRPGRARRCGADVALMVLPTLSLLTRPPPKDRADVAPVPLLCLLAAEAVALARCFVFTG